MVLHDLHSFGGECVRVVCAILTMRWALISPQVHTATALEIVEALPLADGGYLQEGGLQRG
jgi:hypothetical protein